MSQYDSQFEENLYQLRREKLAQIAALGQPTYPNSFAFTHTLKPEIEGVPALLPLGADKSAEALEAEHITASVAGRILAIRLQGKAGFATLQQGGARLQIYVRKDDVGEPAFELYKLLDLGDHIGVTGTLMRTRSGELTLKVQTLTFLTKAMLPLPDKFSGLGDIELRYRRRYLDLFTDTGDSPSENSVILSGGLGSKQDRVPQGFSLGSHGPVKNEEGALAPEVQAGPTQTRLPARTVFVKRAAILRAIRAFFETRGYLEVETPMLHTIAGGAAARTFTTHHNAEDMDLTLRIAPELFLKRLVVGGLDRVYEINRNFRNEGIDRTHNPEFTMLEFYQAYANYHDLMDLTQELIQFVAMEINGTTLTTFNSTTIELKTHNWTRLSMREAIIKHWSGALGTAPKMQDFASSDQLTAWLQRTQNEPPEHPMEMFAFPGVSPASYIHAVQTTIAECLSNLSKGEAYGKSIAAIFEAVSEPFLNQPHIIYDFPLAVSPLSKIKPDEPDWTERFEFYIGGMEIGNAFSELNDPDDQLRRFAAQVADKEPESMAAIDYDYVRALGYGLPPTAGEGIGIDRLTMILTGSRTIRDVILFPLMRPAKATEPPPTEGKDS